VPKHVRSRHAVPNYFRSRLGCASTLPMAPVVASGALGPDPHELAAMRPRQWPKWPQVQRGPRPAELSSREVRSRSDLADGPKGRECCAARAVPIPFRSRLDRASALPRAHMAAHVARCRARARPTRNGSAEALWRPPVLHSIAQAMQMSFAGRINSREYSAGHAEWPRRWPGWPPRRGTPRGVVLTVAQTTATIAHVTQIGLAGGPNEVV